MTERVITLKGFFEEAREGRLSAIRCGSCGELAIPPKELCPSCHERRWELVPLHGTWVGPLVKRKGIDITNGPAVAALVVEVIRDGAQVNIDLTGGWGGSARDHLVAQGIRVEPVALHGTGSVVSFTVIRIPPRGRLAEAPYAVAVVKLDEGVSLLGRIDGIPLDALTAGLSDRFRPLLFDDQVIIGFGPA